MPCAAGVLGSAEAGRPCRPPRGRRHSGCASRRGSRTRVDLPAPLSPMRAVTWPRRICAGCHRAGPAPGRRTSSSPRAVEKNLATRCGGLLLLELCGHFSNLARKAASDDDHADGEWLVELGEPEPGQAVDQSGEQQGADHRADDRGPATEEADATEHDRGHGVEQEARVDGRLCRTDSADEQYARRRRPRRGDHVDGDLDAISALHARWRGRLARIRRLRARAPRTPCGRAPGVPHRDHDGEDDRPGDHAEPVDREVAAGRRRSPCRLAVGDDQRDRPVAAERVPSVTMKSVIPALGDEQPVEEPHRHAGPAARPGWPR